MGTLREGLADWGYATALVQWHEDGVPGPLTDSADVLLLEVTDISRIRPDLVRGLVGEASEGRRLVVIGTGTAADRVRLLNAGVDACLPASLSNQELLARLVAILRQTGTCGRRLTLREGQLTVDLRRKAASYRGHRLSMSAEEYRSLRELALRVMESRSRRGNPVGDDRLTTSLRRLSDYAEKLEQDTESSMRAQAYPRGSREEARSAKA